MEKYVATDPTSEEIIYHSRSTLKEMKNLFWAMGNGDKVKKIGNGYYSAGNWEIVDTKKHPRCSTSDDIIL
tara:strand:+ start:42 stop:254 length:213 start_codon:yes stop_codon:yes gene_type:complete